MRRATTEECLAAMNELHHVFSGSVQVLTPLSVQTLLAKIEHDGNHINRQDLLRYLYALCLSHEYCRVERLIEHL